MNRTKEHGIRRAIFCGLAVLCMVCTAAMAEEDDSFFEMIEQQGESSGLSTATPQAAETAAPTATPELPTPYPEELAMAEDEALPEDIPQGENEVRQDFIERIIDLAQVKYKETGGKAQRAASGSDIYVCKNFTTYLFRENREDFRMAEYPEVSLVIPDNQTKEDCEPYVYGVEWKDIPASEGNPFEEAAAFRYDADLSKEENVQAARAFMQQAKRGDFFQMAANYYYGIGAHSMIIIGDYDAATDTIRWTDSNMKGEKRNGERYGYVQFDAEKEIDWFVEAFCRKGYGATLYRLRDDIVYKS